MKEYVIHKTDHTIRYHDLPGEGTPILFVHGLGCAGSFDYPEVAGQKALKCHRKILVDLLGAGFSDKPDDFGYSVEDHAKYLKEFVEDLGLESFILLGHSMGGAVALSLANMCRDRVGSIILSESNLDVSGENSTSRYIANFDMDDFISEGFDRLVKESRGSADKIWSASLSVWSPKAAYLASKSLAEGVKPVWREILYSLECPKTFIFGEKSLPDPDLQILSDHGVNIETVKDAGHSMAWENPQGFAEAVKRGVEHGKPR